MCIARLGGNAGRAGDAERGHARAGLDQQRVGVAVVAAFELDDEVAAGEAARQTDGRHAGLGAGADEAQLLDGGKQRRDQFGEVGFAGVGGAEAGASAGGLADGLDDRRERRGRGSSGPRSRRGRGSGCRPRRRDTRLRRRADEGRIAADGAKGADGRVDSAGEE